MASERPASEEGVANIALGHAREAEIATLADNSHRARSVRRHFGAVRDALLARPVDWNFASAWSRPAAAVGVQLGNFATHYPMDPDCLRIRAVKDAAEDDWESVTSVVLIGGVEVEAKVLATDLSAPEVNWTRKIVAVRLWDPLFVDAFAWLLAAALAPAVGKAELAADLRAQAEQILIPLAARADAKEKAKSKVAYHNLPSWLAARRYGARR